MGFLSNTRFIRKTPVLALLLALGLPARSLAVGETGAVELKIPVGVSAIAMGQAYVAVANDANAVYWNPAGLRQLGGFHLTAQYDAYIAGVQYGYAAAGTKLGNDMAFGLGVKYLTTGTEPAVDSSGMTTGGTIGETYYDIDLALAYKLNYYLDIGITAKYITKALATFNAATFAGDIGLLYQTPLPHLSAGLNIQNIGPGMKFDQVTDPLPLNVKVGFAYKMFEDNFTMAYDMNFPNDNAISASLGGQYWWNNTLVGRFGYRFQGAVDQNQVGGGFVPGLYLGAGFFGAVFKNFNVGLDYAWTNDGFLGANHHFALNLYF